MGKDEKDTTGMGQDIRRYLRLRFDQAKLEGVDVLSQLLTAFVLLVICLILGASMLTYILLGLAYVLAPWVGGIGVSLFIIAGIVLLLLVVVFLCRKQWIMAPLIRFVYRLFFPNDVEL